VKSNDIFSKTMPFVWAKLLLGIATVVVSAIILGILLTVAWLFKSPGVGFVMVIIWLGLTGIVRFILNHYIGYMIKVGHIAVITEAVVSGKVPENQVAFGKQAVKERFATSNIYFVLDKLVAGAVRQIQRVVGKVTNAMSALPIPGMGAVSGLAQFYVSLSLGYIDECCLGYTFYKKKQSAFKSAADGVVIYAQNIKTLLADAAKTMLFVVLTFTGITLGLFLIFGLVFRLLSWPGWIGFIIAVFLAIAIKYAFMDSILLIRTMVAYMGVAPNTKLTVDLYGNLCNVSAKFKELFNKGQQEEGKPEIAAQIAAPAATSLSGIINQGKEKLSAALDGDSSKSVDTVFCSECGKKNDRGSKFCNSCGALLQKAASGTVEKKATADKEQEAIEEKEVTKEKKATPVKKAAPEKKAVPPKKTTPEKKKTTGKTVTKEKASAKGKTAAKEKPTSKGKTTTKKK
jgi:hypothetical protein